MRDQYFMRKALALAERGRGRTSPNPMVGALVVDADGVIVGRGWHEVAGGPHAEVFALRGAGARAAGATLYCTLEPCSHTGRTGPCAPLVTSAGIRRAVIALEDPNPLVHGSGLQYLRDRGVTVDVGVLAEEAARQNAAFLTTVRRGRPFVILKAAVSLDGCIAAEPGVRTALTGATANRLIHQQRAEVDAIAVGSGTMVSDDPSLTPRGAFRARPLSRIVFDRALRTPPEARVFRSREIGPILIISTNDQLRAHPDRAAALERAGAQVIGVEKDGVGAAMAWLSRHGVTSLVLEGGARLHRAALDGGVVDLVQLYITPRRLQPKGLPWIDEGRFTVAGLTNRRAGWLGADVRIEGYVYRTD